ncbi:pyrimidine nucleotide-sugar transmembrane transporter [Aureococcus anophagefferens]|nr:pyrimidine nucleotide-sugar transmembrane transporter [Aureococcus anophagefferens]
MTSLVIEGAWAAMTDSANILEHGLWYGFDYKAMISVGNSAMGGLTVAAVLVRGRGPQRLRDGHLRAPHGRHVHAPLRHVLNAERPAWSTSRRRHPYNAKNLDATQAAAPLSPPLDRPSG